MKNDRQKMILEIIAQEVVETQEQLAAALAAGCDFIQGFYFSRVLPEREAERYLREHIHIQQ